MDNKVKDIYGERLDYPVEELVDMINSMSSNPFESDKQLKAWLLTPGAMIDLYKDYTNVNIFKRPAYFTVEEMEEYIKLYTRPMQRIIDMCLNETPFRIAQYEGAILIIDYLEDYH